MMLMLLLWNTERTHALSSVRRSDLSSSSPVRPNSALPDERGGEEKEERGQEEEEEQEERRIPNSLQTQALLDIPLNSCKAMTEIDPQKKTA